MSESDGDSDHDEQLGWDQSSIHNQYRRMQAEKQRAQREKAQAWAQRKAWLWAHAVALIACASVLLVALLWYVMGLTVAFVAGALITVALGYWHYKRTRHSVVEDAMRMLQDGKFESARGAIKLLDHAYEELNARAAQSFLLAKTFLQNKSESEFLRRQKAATFLKQADEKAKAIMRDESIGFISSYRHLGECYKYVGHTEKVLRMWEQLRLWWRLLAVDDAAECRQYMQFLRTFAAVATDARDHSLAARLLQEVNDLTEQTAAEDGGGQESIGMVHGLVGLANAHLDAADPKKANPVLKKAYALLEKVITRDNPGMSAHHNPLAINIITHLAKAALLSKNAPKAIELFETAVGRMEEVQKMYEEAAAAGQTQEDGEPINSDDVLRQRSALMQELAMLHASQKAWTTAEKMLRELETDLGSHFGSAADERLTVLATLVRVFRMAGGAKDSRIEPVLAEIRDLVEERNGHGSEQHAMASLSIADLHQEQGKLADAAGELDVVLKMLSDCEDIGPKHPQYMATLQQRAGLLQKLGRKAEAEAAYQHCMAVLEENFGRQDPRLAALMCEVGDMHLANKDFDKAQNVLPLALQSLRESYQFTPQHRMALEKNIALVKQMKKPGSGKDLAPLQKELDIVQTVQAKLEAGMSMDQIAMELQAGVARPASSGGRAALGSSPRGSTSVGKPVNRKKMRKKKAQ